jgi:hypothetical protein
LTTTQRLYIKDVPENKLEAMKQLEGLGNDRETTQEAPPAKPLESVG